MVDSVRSASTEPVYSSYRGEEDFQELLGEFLQSAQIRRHELQTSFLAGEIDAVRAQAHQLKGAGGGYGFEGLSALAAELENVCKFSNSSPEEIAPLLDELVNYLSRIRI